jgi:hypothetical protein
MLKRLSDGQELGELVSTVRISYVNVDSITHFDFHQSLLSFGSKIVIVDIRQSRKLLYIICDPPPSLAPGDQR